MKNKFTFTLISLCWFLKGAQAQETHKPFEYGVGCRLTMDLMLTDDHCFWWNWRAALSAGIANTWKLWDHTFYRPTAHLDLVLAEGGIGTSDAIAYQHHNISERKTNGFAVLTLHPIQFGYSCKKEDQENYSYEGKPFYYFSDFTYPVLTNPFQFSGSIGTSFSYNHFSNKIQRIAIGSFSACNFTAIYANDGPPFAMGKIFGDQKDRWFTGDGLVNYYNNNFQINNIEIAFHRFTGYVENSFETAVDLGLSEVDYNNPEQNCFNTGLFSFRVLSTQDPFNIHTDNTSGNHYLVPSWGAGINFYDYNKYDVQYLLHFNKYYSFHVSPNPKKTSLTLYGNYLFKSDSHGL